MVFYVCPNGGPERRCTYGRRFSPPILPREEVRRMPITITVHIGQYTVTIRIKAETATLPSDGFNAFSILTKLLG